MNEPKLEYNRKSYTVPDYYKHYLTTIDRDTIYEIDYSTYRKILNAFFKFLRDEILEESREVKLPCVLGTLSVVKSQPKEYTSKSLRVDYHLSKQYGKLMFHLNEETNGFKYRYHWCKRTMRTKNKSKYRFIATRANKRYLAYLLKNNLKDYPEI